LLIINLNLSPGTLQIQSEYFVGLEIELAKCPFSQKGVHFAPFTVEVSVVYAEVTENFGFLRLEPQFRVPENDEIIVVGDWLFVGQYFEGALVPQTHQKSETDLRPGTVNHFATVGGDVFAVNGFEHNDDV